MEASTFSEVCRAVVQCGTRRILVFDGSELSEPPARESEIAALMVGASLADGIGGDHYQLNKAAEGWPAGDHMFRFRFYQVERAERRVVNDLECVMGSPGFGVEPVDGAVLQR